VAIISAGLRGVWSSYTRAAISARPSYDSPHRCIVEAMLNGNRDGSDDFVTGQGDDWVPEIENAAVATNGHCRRLRRAENCHG
jgi:hypothetical protein